MLAIALGLRRCLWAILIQLHVLSESKRMISCITYRSPGTTPSSFNSVTGLFALRRGCEASTHLYSLSAADNTDVQDVQCKPDR
ncbi:hypothetical protein BDR04DRAFT_328954 [Suillus decipiens]|nr:hypothetical protein BDR04DRAFT_328954 [Suillus decipiens]